MRFRFDKNIMASDKNIHSQDNAERLSSTVSSSGKANRRSVARIAVIIVSLLVVCLAVALRVLAIGREPVNSDEAVVALMAHEILHGHFFTFYWGQNYGGVEPYIVALAFLIFGQSTMVLGLVPVFLDLVAAFFLYRIGKRLFTPEVSLGAALLFLIWPEVYIWQSTLEYGFRYIALDIGLAMVLLVLNMIDNDKVHLHQDAKSSQFQEQKNEVNKDDAIEPIDKPVNSGKKLINKKVLQSLLLGLLAGLGWWATPEIAYFIFPIAIVIIYNLFRRQFKVSVWQLSVFVLGIIIGALPWLYDNVGKGFPSLHAGPQQNPSFTEHFRLFITHVLPMMLGLRLIASGNWLWGEHIGLALYALFLLFAAAYFVFNVKKKTNLLLVLFLLLFPFIYAYSPFTWYWQDGRYAIYLAPFLSLYVVAGAIDIIGSLRGFIAGNKKALWAKADNSSEAINSQSADESHISVDKKRSPTVLPSASIAVILIIGLVLTMSAIVKVIPFIPSKYVENRTTWLSFSTNSENWLSPAVDILERDHITDVYAGYWIAYALAFASGETITATSPLFYRYYPYADDVYGASKVAWIFPNPRRLAYAEQETSTSLLEIGCVGGARTKAAPGLGLSGCLTLGEMKSYLYHTHDKFQILSMGDLLAVVPSQRVEVYSALAAEHIK